MEKRYIIEKLNNTYVYTCKCGHLFSKTGLITPDQINYIFNILHNCNYGEEN